MRKITPFLWFDDNAEEAVKLYTTLFKNSKMGSVTRYGKEGPGPEGQIMTISFTLDGQEFTALNGGPIFKFTEAISFVVQCEDQKEVNRYWSKLTKGGEESMCGWLKDKFGLSWQIVPVALLKLLQLKDPVKKSRVMQAMMKMKKLEIKPLEAAAK